MTLRDHVLFNYRRTRAKILSRIHEAARRWSGSRSTIDTPMPQDARWDITAMDRLEIVRKSRYFEANNAVVNRLSDLFEQFTVGPNGLRLTPASVDQEWNQRARVVWDEWTPFADLTSRQHFGTLQSLIARAWFTDGECFLLKSYGESVVGGRVIRRPRLQLIEAHRICNPPWTAEGPAIIDGVEIDFRGRPVAYWLKEPDLATDLGTMFGASYPNPASTERFRRLEADTVVHIFEPSRPGQYRGIPFLAPVLNDLHDLDDLQALEMLAAKEEASVTWALETESGEVPPQFLSSRERYAQRTQTPTGTETTEDRTKYLTNVLGGGRKIALRLGEKLNRMTGERPSLASREYWDYLTSKVCAGVGISKLLVFPWSMQGTVTRADLDVANAFFRARSAVLGNAFTEIWRWVMDWHTRFDVRVADAPDDWRNLTVRAPRSVNVDVGRNASALVSEYLAGWRTLEGICGELGEDYRDVLRQRAIERQMAHELEEEYELQPGELIEATLKAIQAQPPAAPMPDPEMTPA